MSEPMQSCRLHVLSVPDGSCAFDFELRTDEDDDLLGAAWDMLQARGSRVSAVAITPIGLVAVVALS